MSEIPANLPSALPSGGPAVQSSQLKAAQAAFFRAALGEVQAAPRPQASPTAPVSEPETPRPPRPGQLLDIRV